MTADCIFWAVTGLFIGIVLGMFVMLCRFCRDVDDLYDTAFDSGVEYERENQRIADWLRRKETEVFGDAAKDG